MNKQHLPLLACPKCHRTLSIVGGEPAGTEVVVEGTLKCDGCGKEYPVSGGVPRFVPRENYASGFGLEWTRHARTQYDSASGTTVSRDRFFEQTQWPERLEGELILEVGSGSGRFTEQAAKTGATVVSLDYSYAVDANFQSNGARRNVLIVQADVFEMPFANGSFDKLFCFGMLQHTPDPRRAFLALPPMVKPGGMVVADIYKLTPLRALLNTKYYVRPFTKNLDPEKLYKLVQRWVDFMWPIASLIRRLPKGHGLNWRLLVADYSALGLKGDALKQWAYLDTFDMLAPRFDYPARLATFKRWFEDAGLKEIFTEYSPHGITGRGVR